MKTLIDLSRFKNLSLAGDLFGGLTTAIVSLPLALAFGVASGAGAEAGLWGAILVGLFASIFGGSTSLISEPTGPMTVVMTAVLSAMIAANPDQGVAMAFTVVMMAGVFQICLGALKLGKYITLMPYSVISGFMSGIGVILIILQLAPFLGQPTPPGGVTGTLSALPNLLLNISFSELFLGLVTLGILFYLPKQWRRRIPPQLVALVAVTLLSIIIFSDDGVRRIGAIPSGLPDFHIPTFTFDQMMTMVLNALVLGTLGCIDTLLTAVIADSLTRNEHDSNRELIGQGIANTLSGFCGGLPGAGATMGTVVNVQSGGKSPLAGITRALILLTVVLGASSLTQMIPMAVLAGISLYVGINILDWSFIQRAHKVALSPTIIMYGVMALTIFVDLMVAVGIGVFIANILTIEKLSRLQETNVKAISDADDGVPLKDDERALLDSAKGKVLFFYLSGPMIFGVSKAIARQHNRINEYEAVVIDLSAVPMMDLTIGLALENAIIDAVDAGCAVYIFSPNGQTTERLEKLGVMARLPNETFCDTRINALTSAVTSINLETSSEKEAQG
ncbi:SulP family inorganic anion transporter [Marinomonas mediterranea]|uniref:Sulphate transporter n=1 Tax=Marinomonas mediterranea (strain ATCC 700492 / JCM 21426 / NBRC 103028 / MMB-1) TaxID=717774 RepID=F2K3A4_MARM1|nr:SulP family inorganic anion transporter [Marinomonas mediterranea]ADZ91246.1 sulphate transporter [Marinomonas mediterranea MMB-1]WCN09219.1 STAS domain-containing protein [Marinomonas mediterranea]WCN13302.1 STAS domain-containing protein [Marinomonas mediterranea]WCN17370.1 STAS domain-containing protein [Marinomonas mediterranea MMB-1]